MRPSAITAFEGCEARDYRNRAMRERAGASVLADGASASVCGAGLLGSSISYGLEHKEVYPELTAESEIGRLSWRLR